MRLTLCRLMPGVTKNKVRKPRKFNIYFSNKWHEQSEIVVKDEGYREACESRGIRVYNPEEIFRPYLPDLGMSEEELEKYQKSDPVIEKITDPMDHPDYHHKPCKLFNKVSRLIKYKGIEQAKCLTNSVSIETGLPNRILKTMEKVGELMPDAEERIQDVLMESCVFDATQKKLPRNAAVPNIGWNAVIDRMHRPLPYPEPKFSWGRGVRREYGIPNGRKSMILGMMNTMDSLALDLPELLERQHLQKVLLRQSFEKMDELVQIQSPLSHVVTAKSPVKPYADKKAVEETKDLALPDLQPLNSLSYLFDQNIYKDDNSFCVQSQAEKFHVHTCFEIDSSITKFRSNSEYHGRSLIMAFGSALAQARVTYGENVKGVLPEPITVHFINTNGKDFYFSVFQLNTLDLEGDIKNIFWHESETAPLFETCEYVYAVPTLEGYNHDIFKKMLAMYLQNTNSV